MKVEARSHAMRQCIAVIRQLYDIPLDADSVLEQMLSRVDREVREWHRQLVDDVVLARCGYPSSHRARNVPDVEDGLDRLAKITGVDVAFSRRKLLPRICLTHDVDYLWSTPQYRIKTCISARRLAALFAPTTTFLDSLSQILTIDSQFGSSLVFVAMPRRVAGMTIDRLAQWLIDPSYHHSKMFWQLKSLLDEPRISIGLHGSYFALSRGLLSSERATLQAATGRIVKASRQHWLNIARLEEVAVLRNAELRLDSSLGWNGCSGFRGGICRPFPLVGADGRAILELPLLLMDGPIFQTRGLRASERMSHCLNLLNEVKRRGGCIALDWHERAAHPRYCWHSLYEDILHWCKAEGFNFVSADDIISSTQLYAL